ncbi:hypothetical protein J503_2638 [Acinetobacter baumannii 984213]|nr:hypothetical protein J503_2638 [Acinetobacter baumannii 984213]
MLYKQIAVYVYQLDDFLITPSNVKKSGDRSLFYLRLR